MMTLSKQETRFARLMNNPVIKFYKHNIVDSIVLVKKHGFRELLKRRGKKILVLIVSYYTIRDTLLYIVLPMLVAKGIL